MLLLLLLLLLTLLCWVHASHHSMPSMGMGMGPFMDSESMDPSTPAPAPAPDKPGIGPSSGSNAPASVPGHNPRLPLSSLTGRIVDRPAMSQTGCFLDCPSCRSAASFSSPPSPASPFASTTHLSLDPRVPVWISLSCNLLLIRLPTSTPSAKTPGRATDRTLKDTNGLPHCYRCATSHSPVDEQYISTSKPGTLQSSSTLSTTSPVALCKLRPLSFERKPTTLIGAHVPNSRPLGARVL